MTLGAGEYATAQDLFAAETAQRLNVPLETPSPAAPDAVTPPPTPAPTPPTPPAPQPSAAAPPLAPPGQAQAQDPTLARLLSELNTTLQRIGQQPVAAPVRPDVPRHIAVLQQLTQSTDPEKAAMAYASLELIEAYEKRFGTLDEAVAGERRSREQLSLAQVEEQMDREVQETAQVIGLTPEESSRARDAWDKACQRDDSLGALTFEEWCYRYYGRDAVDARRAATRGRPNPAALPANPGGVVAVSSAGGGPAAPWTPPQRPRGATLEDAHRAAMARHGGG